EVAQTATDAATPAASGRKRTAAWGNVLIDAGAKLLVGKDAGIVGIPSEEPLVEAAGELVARELAVLVEVHGGHEGHREHLTGSERAVTAAHATTAAATAESPALEDHPL